MYTNHIVTITKKFIIDLLNNLWFSDVVMFDDISQFSDLYSMNIVYLDDGYVLDQRCTLFAHRFNNCGFRCLISCIRNDDFIKSVCYRITNISSPVALDDQKLVLKPFDNMRFDYSISDLQLGVKDTFSYSFHDNVGYIVNEQTRMFNMLKFILSSDYIAYNKSDIFTDLINDSLSRPPTEDDIHYSPIYLV